MKKKFQKNGRKKEKKLEICFQKVLNRLLKKGLLIIFQVAFYFKGGAELQRKDVNNGENFLFGKL